MRHSWCLCWSTYHYCAGDVHSVHYYITHQRPEWTSMFTCSSLLGFVVAVFYSFLVFDEHVILKFNNLCTWNKLLQHFFIVLSVFCVICISRPTQRDHFTVVQLSISLLSIFGKLVMPRVSLWGCWCSVFENKQTSDEIYIRSGQHVEWSRPWSESWYFHN